MFNNINTFGLLSVEQKMLCFKFLGAGLATIALGGSGCGAGILFGCYLQALAANPEQADKFVQPLLLGFALTEAVGLLALCMAFLILFF